VEIVTKIAPICLALIMFGLGTSLTIEEFKRVVKQRYREGFAVDGVIDSNFWNFQRRVKKRKQENRNRQNTNLLKLTATLNEAEDALFHS